MKILSLHAKNFRTLENIQIEFSGDYSTISGKNNAGKSSIIKILCAIFRGDDGTPWSIPGELLSYAENKTQWIKDDKSIEINCIIVVSKADDPSLAFFIEKITDIKTQDDKFSVNLIYNIDNTEEMKLSISINGKKLDDRLAAELDKRIKESKTLNLYNSTTPNEDIFIFRGRSRSIFDLSVSQGEKNKLDLAAKQLENQIKKLAKEYVKSLVELLGGLTEKYDVEITPPEGFITRRMPLGISLKDKSVDVPIDEWGSGTQNRTRILMSIMRANKLRISDRPENQLTPIVVIEEPESFLHPAAQAEFGKMLRNISTTMGIQIVVTTHSPYMLNQEHPESNILLSRRQSRGKFLETYRISTENDGWMEPFAEHLGIKSAEFSRLRPIFGASTSRVLLVEGEIDKKYFDFFRTPGDGKLTLKEEIEIVSYGGSSTLKNTALIQFVLRKFDKVFIIFDLDCESESKSFLSRIDDQYVRNSMALGVNVPGKDRIEGLVPDRILSHVFGKNTDLVMAMSGSGDTSKKAKQRMKVIILDEYLSRSDLKEPDFRNFNKIIKKINEFFS